MKRRQFLNHSAKSGIAIITALSPLNHFVMAGTIPQTGLVLDDHFKHHHISPNHPESPDRYYAIKKEFSEQDLFAKTVRIKPLGDVDNELRLIHTEEHIKSIRKTDAKTHRNASLATGGVLAAIDQVCSGKLKNAFCATRPPGHHARNTGKEEGFCYYNHVAIAARYAQKKYQVKKILIVDWDYHHGNGTEEAFYRDQNVLFFSTHDYYAYPGTGDPEKKGEGTGKGLNINVHLDCGAGDNEIIQAFETQLIPAAEKFKPDLILISSGFDSRVDDLLGCHKVTDEGFAQLTSMVMVLAETYCQGRLVSVLEGGYNIRGNAKAAAAHVSALMIVPSVLSPRYAP